MFSAVFSVKTLQETKRHLGKCLFFSWTWCHWEQWESQKQDNTAASTQSRLPFFFLCQYWLGVMYRFIHLVILLSRFPSYSMVISLPMYVSLILVMAEWPITPAVATSKYPPASTGQPKASGKGRGWVGENGGIHKSLMRADCLRLWELTLGLTSCSTTMEDCCAIWWMDCTRKVRNCSMVCAW